MDETNPNPTPNTPQPLKSRLNHHFTAAANGRVGQFLSRHVHLRAALFGALSTGAFVMGTEAVWMLAHAPAIVPLPLEFRIAAYAVGVPVAVWNAHSVRKQTTIGARPKATKLRNSFLTAVGFTGGALWGANILAFATSGALWAGAATGLSATAIGATGGAALGGLMAIFNPAMSGGAAAVAGVGTGVGAGMLSAPLLFVGAVMIATAVAAARYNAKSLQWTVAPAKDNASNDNQNDNQLEPVSKPVSKPVSEPVLQVPQPARVMKMGQ